jgi:hypothetical protein
MTHIPLDTSFAHKKICRTPKCKSRSNENRIMLPRNTLITHTHTHTKLYSKNSKNSMQEEVWMPEKLAHGHSLLYNLVIKHSTGMDR